MTEQPGRCLLGHATKAMECPGCAEANGSETSIDWWRWYKSRTSSKAVKAAIVEHLVAMSGNAARVTDD